MNFTQHNLRGFWDDNLQVPTIYLDDTPVDTPVDMPVDDPTIYDARDAWAQGIGTPPLETALPATVTSPSASSSWSLRDILNVGKDIAQTVVQYKATQVPGGPRLYTTIDPRTGRPIIGGGNLTIGAGILDTLKQNLPLLLLIGAGAMVITAKDNKK